MDLLKTDNKYSSLLPCPFCGGDAEIKQMGTNRVSMIIGCTDCSCELETGETSINEHSQWNTRTVKRDLS